MIEKVIEEVHIDDNEDRFTAKSLGLNQYENQPHTDSSGEGGSFTWLMNSYQENVWFLKPHIESDEPSKYTVNWLEPHLEEMSGWGYWVDVCKDVCVVKMSREDKRKVTTSSLAGYARALKSLVRFLFLVRNCSLMEDVSVEDINAYKEALVSRKLRCSSLESVVIPLHDLYILRDSIRQPLKFDPFLSTTKAQWAKVNGVPNGHTETLVPREVFFLLNEALKRISTSRSDLDLFHVYMKLRERDGYIDRNVGSKFRRATGKSSGELIKRIRELYGAALVVTLLMTAERKHEATLREESDIVELLESELDILGGLEKKTSGTTSGRKTEVPVISEVKDAFRVIMEITQYTRKIAGTSKILLKLPVAHSTSGDKQKHYYLSTNPMYSILRHFGESCGFNVKLRPHMFRRAYSKLWGWRYEVGDLYELSRMLKHHNDLFTRRYTDGDDIWSFLPDSHQKLAFHVLNDSFSRKVKVSGGASKTLERYSRIIQAKSKILDPTEIANFIDNLLESGEINIIVHADGYCVFTKENKGQCRCLDSDGEIDVAKREETRCAGCPNLGIDDRRNAYWQKRIELHQQVVDKSTNSSLVEKSKRFISDIKMTLQTH